MISVRTARPDEFDQVMTFYTRMIDEMHGTDFDVLWKHGEHPSPAFLRESVDAGQVLVGVFEDESGETADGMIEGAPIACALVMNGEGAPGYENVPWRVACEPDKIAVVHVVATLPAYHGRGYARILMEACVEAARAAGMRSLRLDVFAHNARARSLYESCGFEYRGEFPLVYDDLSTVMPALYECAL